MIIDPKVMTSGCAVGARGMTDKLLKDLTTLAQQIASSSTAYKEGRVREDAFLKMQEDLADEFGMIADKLDQQGVNRHVVAKELANRTVIAAIRPRLERIKGLKGKEKADAYNDLYSNEAIEQAQEFLMGMFGGNVYSNTLSDVNPMAGFQGRADAIRDKLLKDADLLDIVDETFLLKAGAIRVGKSHKKEMDLLKAKYKEKGASDWAKNKMNKIETAMRDSVMRANAAMNLNKFDTENVLNLPSTPADLRTIGRKKFVDLATNGNYTTVSGEEITPDVASQYWDTVSNHKGADLMFDTPRDPTSIPMLQELESAGIRAKNAQAHYDYIKAAKVESVADYLSITAQNIAQREAIAKTFTINPQELKQALIDQHRGFFQKVFDDKFSRRWDAAVNIASGRADMQGFETNAILRSGIAIIDNMFRVIKALTLRNAAQSAPADSPYRAQTMSFMNNNPAALELIKDVGMTMFRSGSDVLMPGMTRERARRIGHVMDTATQDLYGPAAGRDADPTQNYISHTVQKIVSGWHGFTGFRAVNNGAQLHSMYKAYEILRIAFQKGNFDELDIGQQGTIQGLLFLDGRTYNKLRAKAKLDSEDIDIFEGVELEAFEKDKLEAAIRAVKRPFTGRASIAGQTYNPLKEFFASERGTLSRTAADISLPFLSPLINQVQHNATIYTKMKQKYPPHIAGNNTKFAAEFATKYFVNTMIPLMVYGHMRAQFAYYATHGEWMKYGEVGDDDKDNALGKENLFRSILYAAMPVASLFYDYNQGIAGAELGDLFFTSLVDTWDVVWRGIIMGEKDVDWEKVARRRLPTHYTAPAKGLGILDEDFGE